MMGKKSTIGLNAIAPTVTPKIVPVMRTNKFFSELSGKRDAIHSLILCSIALDLACCTQSGWRARGMSQEVSILGAARAEKAGPYSSCRNIATDISAVCRLYRPSSKVVESGLGLQR
jgi:hypothetical protein